LYLLPRG